MASLRRSFSHQHGIRSSGIRCARSVSSASSCCSPWRLRRRKTSSASGAATSVATFPSFAIAPMRSRCAGTLHRESSRYGCLNWALSIVVPPATKGSKEASLVDVSTQPFRRHPVIPHSLTAFRLCHLSRWPGSRTDDCLRKPISARGQGNRQSPSRPLHRGGCGQCHQNELEGDAAAFSLRVDTLAPLQLRSLPFRQTARWHSHDCQRSSATACTYRRQDDTRMALQLVKGPSSLCCVHDHAELQAQRRGRQRYLRVPD